MKLIDITLKDMLQSTRNLFALMFMFVIPMLVTALFYFMFGGIASDEGFELPRTTVQIVNLDEGQLPAGGAGSVEAPVVEGLDLSQVESMGALLAQILQEEDFSEVMVVSEVDSAAEARAAVDNQEAAVAVIIPADFSDAMLTPGGSTSIEMYQDPTLTIGPAVVASIVGQIVDGFAANSIGAAVAIEQLATAGAQLNPALMSDVVSQITAGTVERGSQGASALIDVRTPEGAEADSGGGNLVAIVGLILSGMLVFFTFFTGGASTQSILTEDEKGTLARLFTTPTSHLTILGGKFLAVVITLMVQVTVLLLFGGLVFGIQWGDPAAVAVAAFGIVLISATTGLFLVSIMKDTRQAGIIFGGVLTLTGMIGMMTVFTGGSPNAPSTLQTVSLLVPQGWAIRGLRLAQEGSGPIDLLWPTLAVIIIWSLVFAAIGQYRLGKRFA